LSPELLAGHAIRIDKILTTCGDVNAIESYLDKLYPDAGFMVSSSGSFVSVDMKGTYQDGENRFNLNFIVGSYHGEAPQHLSIATKGSHFIRDLDNRSEVFERDEQNNWRRISVRLSCFRLAADFRKTGYINVPN
jgi:hypothetical protein